MIVPRGAKPMKKTLEDDPVAARREADRRFTTISGRPIQGIEGFL